MREISADERWEMGEEVLTEEEFDELAKTLADAEKHDVLLAAEAIDPEEYTTFFREQYAEFLQKLAGANGCEQGGGVAGRYREDLNLADEHLKRIGEKTTQKSEDPDKIMAEFERQLEVLGQRRRAAKQCHMTPRGDTLICFCDEEEGSEAAY